MGVFLASQASRPRRGRENQVRRSYFTVKSKSPCVWCVSTDTACHFTV
jgi:hypothetical protein